VWTGSPYGHGLLAERPDLFRDQESVFFITDKYRVSDSGNGIQPGGGILQKCLISKQGQ